MKSVAKRIIAWILIIMLVFSMFAGALTMLVKAATDDYENFVVKNAYSNMNISYIGVNSTVTIEFDYIATFNSQDVKPVGFATNEEYVIKKDNLTLNHDLSSYIWDTNSDTELRLKVLGSTSSSGNQWNVKATLKNVTYRNNSKKTALSIKVNDSSDLKDYTPTLYTNVPSDYFVRSTSSTSDDSIQYTPEIRIENVYVTDIEGERMDKVTKDSGYFNVDILYADYGLQTIDKDDLPEEMLSVLATNMGGFVSTRGMRGTLTHAATPTDGVPRFRARFSGLKFSGGSNSIGFEVRYDIYGDIVSGDATATVYQAREVTDENNNETPPATPYIIVSKYSYGESQIEAGGKFTLDISYKNTSRDIPLENIVMTVTTPEDLSIASASNTVYIEKLAAGAALSHSIELEAKPGAKVGSHSVQIDFNYQYLVKAETGSAMTRKDAKTTENIAVPVTQIDRFSVDPITEIPEMATAGEQFYVTAGFTNKGKSTTYNISAIARADRDIIVPSQHFGNLEAGKSDSVDIAITANESGELAGEIIIQYEDENTKQKEIPVPFTIFIMEPYVPIMPPPTTMPGEVQAESRLTAANIILCVIGGIAVMVPIIMYMIKRVKAKGSEEFDEDF